MQISAICCVQPPRNQGRAGETKQEQAWNDGNIGSHKCPTCRALYSSGNSDWTTAALLSKERSLSQLSCSEDASFSPWHAHPAQAPPSDVSARVVTAAGSAFARQDASRFTFLL